VPPPRRAIIFSKKAKGDSEGREEQSDFSLKIVFDPSAVMTKLK
jgi:hypothetical protein